MGASFCNTSFKGKILHTSNDYTAFTEKNQPFSVPNGLTFMRVNRRSGVAASSDPSGTIITEAFKPGQAPNPAPSVKQSVSDAVVGGVF